MAKIQSACDFLAFQFHRTSEAGTHVALTKFMATIPARKIWDAPKPLDSWPFIYPIIQFNFNQFHLDFGNHFPTGCRKTLMKAMRKRSCTYLWWSSLRHQGTLSATLLQAACDRMAGKGKGFLLGEEGHKRQDMKKELEKYLVIYIDIELEHVYIYIYIHIIYDFLKGSCVIGKIRKYEHWWWEFGEAWFSDPYMSALVPGCPDIYGYDIHIYILAYMPHEYLIVIVIPGGNKHIFDTINQWWWTNMFPHTFWQDLVGWIFTSERCPGHIPGMEK